MPDEREPPTYFGAPPRALAAGTSLLVRSATHVRISAGFIARTTHAWLRATRRLIVLHLERRGLERRRRELQYELGGAALAEDDARVQDVRAALRSCIGDLERNANDQRIVVGRARDRTSEERSAAARTRVIPPAP